MEQTMKKQFLPTWKELNDLQLASREQFYYIKDLHKKYSDAYDWFVKPYKINNQDTKPYYCKGELPKELYGEVINCNWDKENWNIEPWEYRINPNSITGKDIVEVYKSQRSDKHGHGYNSEEIGGKRLGTRNWGTKFLIGGMGEKVTVWGNKDEKELHMSVRKGDKSIVTDLLKDGSFTTGVFLYREKKERVEDEYVLPVLRELKKKKYKGFYNDLYNFIVEVTGVNTSDL